MRRLTLLWSFVEPGQIAVMAYNHFCGKENGSQSDIYALTIYEYKSEL